MRCCCFFLVALSVCANGFAEETDAKFVEIFLQTHCVRCHNADENKGELNLDDLGTNLAAGRASFAAALERLRPEKRFASASELSSQIGRDLEAARAAVARVRP